MSPLPDQTVHWFVVVQDGTAIVSVVLHRAACGPTARKAGLCSFYWNPAFFDLVRNVVTIISLTDSRVVVPQLSTCVMEAAGGSVDGGV